MKKILTVMMLVGCMFAQLLPSASAQTTTYQSDIFMLDAYETLKDKIPEVTSSTTKIEIEGTSPNGKVAVKANGAQVVVNDSRTTNHFKLFDNGAEAIYYPNIKEGYYRVTVNQSWAAGQGTYKHMCQINNGTAYQYYTGSGTTYTSSDQDIYVGTHYFKGDGTDYVKLSLGSGAQNWYHFTASHITFEKVVCLNPYDALAGQYPTVINMTKEDADASLGDMAISSMSENDLYNVDAGIIAEGSTASGDVMFVAGLSHYFYQQSTIVNPTDSFRQAVLRNEVGINSIEGYRFSKMYYLPNLEPGKYEIIINSPNIPSNPTDMQYSLDGETWTTYLMKQTPNSIKEISIGVHTMKGDGSDILVTRAYGGDAWYASCRYSYVTFRKVDCALDAYKEIGALDTTHRTEPVSKEVTTDDGRIVLDFVDQNGEWTFSNRVNGGIGHYETYNGSSIIYYPNVEPGYYRLSINNPFRENNVASHYYTFDDVDWHMYQRMASGMKEYYSTSFDAGVHYFKGDGTDMVRIKVTSVNTGRLSYITLTKAAPTEFVATKPTGSITGDIATINSYAYNGATEVTPYSEDYTLVIAAYDDGDNLIEVKSYKGDVYRMTGATLSKTYTLPEGAKSVKAFVFDSISGMKPFAESLTLNK